MLETVPAAVEAVIYLYFAVVAAIGLSLHVRLWRTSSASDTSRASDDPARPGSERVD